MTSIGHRIQQFRKMKKMTQQNLAEMAAVDYNTLRKVETKNTKNPSPDFIEKIASALDIPITSLLEDPKPNVGGRDILPFLKLSPDRFEALINALLKLEKRKWIDVQAYGGRGDKNRDVIAKEIIGGKASQKNALFQAKRYTKTTLTTLKTELEGIKKHFFTEQETPTLIEKIIFCLADSPSPTIKDKTKLHASLLKLPEPIIWDVRDLDSMCKEHKEILNEFFGGHFEEIKEELKEGHKQINKNIKESENKVIKSIQEGFKKVRLFGTEQLSSISSQDDAEMQRARRLINEKKYSEAKEILLVLQPIIESSQDSERRKKMYNNLGVCFCQSENKEEMDRGVEFLNKALDLDANFNTPKQNLAEFILRNNVSKNYSQALKLSDELLKSDPNNLDYAALYINALNVCAQLQKARIFFEDRYKSEEEFNSSESLCIVAVQTYLSLDEIDAAKKCVDTGLKNFPESINLNRFKGLVLMAEVEKGGSESRSFDIVPFFLKSNLAEKAAEHFQKALSCAKNENWPQSIQNSIKLELYQAEVISGREDLERLKALAKDIELTLDEEQKKNKLLTDAHLRFRERDFRSAYDLFQQILSDGGGSAYKTNKEIAKKFWRQGSPEYAIKFLLRIADEAKEKKDFEYWALLSIFYSLQGDKNSALRVMNEAKMLFAKDEKNYKDVISHYGALLGRYHSGESDRFVKNIFELQDLMPEETVIKSVKVIELDGSASPEIIELFTKAKRDFEKKRDLFLSNPMPTYFLKKMFGRPYPEALEIPRSNYDFNFAIPYNALDGEFIEKQTENFNTSEVFVIDYCALLNFARCGQLSLFKALKKRVIASEYLLFEVQDNLALNENKILRDAWNFLRNGEVELFPYQKYDKKKNPSQAIQNAFDDDMWLVQSISYCMNSDVIFLTDDLRLLGLMESKEIGIKSVNSFTFFRVGLSQGALDKKQYSLVLGDLADILFHFIPFNGEDLLNIVLDDINRIGSHDIIFCENFKQNPSLKISLRAYHLLNQVNLPGSDVASFLAACVNFLIRFIRLGVLDEEKIDWTLFLTNFFFEFEKTNLVQYREFSVISWMTLIKSIPSKHKNLMMEKAKMIQSDVLRVGVESELNKINL